MGKASSNKKVARAAGTGGGRTARGRRPWLWYGTLSVFVALGIFIITTSRAEYIDGRVAGVAPRLNPGGDHWHAAYGIFLCDEFIPGLTDKQGDEVGIHSHGDGLVHTHPSSKRSAGENAVMERFFDEVSADIAPTSIEVPGRKKMSNGDNCGKEDGEVVVKTWKNQADAEGTLVKGNPGDVRITDGMIITIAFVPKGTELQKPPSVANLANPTDVEQPGGPPPGAPPPGSELPPGTPPPDGSEPIGEIPAPPDGSAPPAEPSPASPPPP